MMWYVYVYCNPLKLSTMHECGFEPFYVGKGQAERCLAHCLPSAMRDDPNHHKVNTIKKILREGAKPVIVKSMETVNEANAYAEEVRLIALYGRTDLGKGPLTNMTDGGEGRTNTVVTADTRALLAEKTRRAHADGKLKDNTTAWSKAGLERAHSPEGRARSAERRTGAKRTIETCANVSASRRQFLASLTEEERAAHLGTMRGKHHTQEAKDKSRNNNPRTMRIEVMGVIYPSLNIAVRTTGINKPKLKVHPTFKVLS